MPRYLFLTIISIIAATVSANAQSLGEIDDPFSCVGLNDSIWEWPAHSDARATFTMDFREGSLAGGVVSVVGNPHVSVGTWHCTSPVEIVVDWGQFKDKLKLVREGQWMMGTNNFGDPFTVIRISRVEAGGDFAQNPGCSGLDGSIWAWPEGSDARATFRIDRMDAELARGSAVATGNPHVSRGTWWCETQNRIIVDWGGFRDTMTLRDNGRRMSGQNQHGGEFAVERVGN